MMSHSKIVELIHYKEVPSNPKTSINLPLVVWKQTIVHEELEEPTLEQLREWVGGHIELIWVEYKGRECMAIINEEGKLDDLPLNIEATNMYHEWLALRGFDVSDVIVGNCAIMTNFDLS